MHRTISAMCDFFTGTLSWHSLSVKNLASGIVCQRRCRMLPSIMRVDQRRPESHLLNPTPPLFQNVLNPGPKFFQNCESDSWTPATLDATDNQQCFFLEKWHLQRPRRPLLLPKMKSESGFGVSKIFDSGPVSERKTRKFPHPDPYPLRCRLLEIAVVWWDFWNGRLFFLNWKRRKSCVTLRQPRLIFSVEKTYPINLALSSTPLFPSYCSAAINSWNPSLWIWPSITASRRR